MIVGICVRAMTDDELKQFSNSYIGCSTEVKKMLYDIGYRWMALRLSGGIDDYWLFTLTNEGYIGTHVDSIKTIDLVMKIRTEL